MYGLLVGLECSCEFYRLGVEFGVGFNNSLSVGVLIEV